jgi:hypothetical protein
LNVFEDNKEIENYIENHKESPNYKLLSNFWILYKNNEYQDVLFDREIDVQSFIVNNLEEQRQQVELLLDIYNHFDNYSITKELRNNINRMPFKIKLKWNVLKMIGDE